MRTFEVRADPIEVTSLHCPNTSWRFVDPAGHEHRWYLGTKPAESYRPDAHYEVPTLAVVFDGYGYYPDGSQYRREHYECRQCGARVTPSYTADTTRQYIAGLKHFYIDGREVAQETFERAFKIAHPDHKP